MKYKLLNKAIIRTPYYPTEVLEKLWNYPLIRKQIWQSDFFRQAIYNASRDLSNRLDLYLKGNLSAKDSIKIEHTLIKYLDRMASRCTPFGLFSCCSIANLTNDNFMEISSKSSPFIRLDMDLAYYIFNQLKKSGFLSSLRYKINSEIYIVGKEYRYIISKYLNGKLEFQIVKTPRSSILNDIINFMNEPKYLHEITDFICSNYEISSDDAQSYTRNLINKQLIYSEVSPTIIGIDYISELKNYLFDDCPFKTLIERINLNLDTIRDSQTFSSTLKAIENIESCLHEQDISNYKYLYQIDSFREIKQGGFPQKISEQLFDCLSVLSKICQIPHNNELEQFKRKFSEKFGEQEISLLVALDPEIGIPYGFSINRSNEIINLLNLPSPNQYKLNFHDSPIFRILIRKLAQNNSDEIEIKEEDTLGIIDSSDSLPDSMFAMFNTFKENNHTNFILSDLMFVAGAANLIARFSCGNKSISKLAHEIFNIEQQNSSAILAEIIHLPNPRIGNVLCRNMTRDYNISCSTNVMIKKGNQIKTNDITICIRNNRLILKSKSLNKEIIPRLTTAHNYMNGSIHIYRFLCDIQYQSQKSVLKFNWCNLDKILEYLPRVRYKNIILSRGKWNINKNEIVTKNNKLDNNAFVCLRNRLNITRFVYFVNGDNKLYLDLDNQTCLDILIDEIKNVDKFVLEEFYPASNFIMDGNGNHFMNECIIPLIKQK